MLWSNNLDAGKFMKFWHPYEIQKGCLVKVCKDCGISKPLTEFFKTVITKRTKEQRYTIRCKKCSMDRYAPNRGKLNAGQYVKGQKPWCTGMKMSDEYRKKLRDAKKKNPINSGSFKSGQIPWNKGKSYKQRQKKLEEQLSIEGKL